MYKLKSNTMSIFKIILISLLPFLVCNCVNNDDINDPKGDRTVPNIPKEVTVRNISGGAVVKYKLDHKPANIRYVKAEVKDEQGNINQYFSSQGVDSLLIDGLVSNKKYTVQLFSYNYADISSDALDIEISPEKAPIELAEIKELRAAFSSVRVIYENPMKDQLFIGLVKKINGHWQQMGMPYATQEKGSVYIQKQDSVRGEYGAYFYDKWGHRSEMQTASLTPLAEYSVDKSLFEYIPFPTDAVSRSDGGKPEVMWDGDYTKTAVKDLFWPWINVPSWVSIDLGKSYILSSFTIWNRYSAPYSYGSVRQFEIWGSNNPNFDESVLPNGQQQIMDPSWFLIGTFETIKPSGSSGQTDADLAYARAGFHFLFSPDYETDIPGSQEVRYVRLLVHNTWFNPLESLRIAELSFWGIPLNK